MFCNCNFPAVEYKLIKSIYVDEINLNCVCLGDSFYEDQTCFSGSTKEEEGKKGTGHSLLEAEFYSIEAKFQNNGSILFDQIG